MELNDLIGLRSNHIESNGSQKITAISMLYAFMDDHLIIVATVSELK